MTLPISASVANARQTLRADAPAKLSDEAEPSAESATRLTLSERSRERLLNAGKATRAFAHAVRDADAAKKDAARKRIEDIKERIKMLRMLVSGGVASKAVLREIRELAQALGQAAEVLAESDGQAKQGSAVDGALASAEVPLDEDGQGAQPTASRPEVASPEDEDAEAQAAPAYEDDVASPSAAVMTLKLYLENLQQARHEDQPDAEGARQRGADAELIEEAVRRLKALLALVKSVREPDDPESSKYLSQVQQHLEASQSAAQGLGGGFAATFPGATLSISV